MRIDNSFFLQNATEAAPALVGKVICLKKENTILKMRIVETECYMGEDDSACHASKGKTARNYPLWLSGGYSYVYLCYGMYYMFNIITGNENDPQGVLIRGVEGYYGPGKFTRYAGIDREYNCVDMRSSDVLWVEDDGFCPEICTSKRVGIDYADEVDREKLWRFTDCRYIKKQKTR